MMIFLIGLDSIPEFGIEAGSGLIGGSTLLANARIKSTGLALNMQVLGIKIKNYTSGRGSTQGEQFWGVSFLINKK
ncbi:hypothetical protein [Paenibacillus sp. PAMC21692]|uniref:hypothetical protein n=1 Tax=Paenibacillus sp. PAMC21692 TaxID=2762320 RepID=UPI00164E04F1|nr:hypothetical protein [Paenibacillus sp. PAMC21692]QNK59886.1 hypothetical protein H7F31_14060 [Paenibacillus sp. PAMC21692]